MFNMNCVKLLFDEEIEGYKLEDIGVEVLSFEVLKWVLNLTFGSTL